MGQQARAYYVLCEVEDQGPRSLVFITEEYDPHFAGAVNSKTDSKVVAGARDATSSLSKVTMVAV